MREYGNFVIVSFQIIFCVLHVSNFHQRRHSCHGVLFCNCQKLFFSIVLYFFLCLFVLVYIPVCVLPESGK